MTRPDLLLRQALLQGQPVDLLVTQGRVAWVRPHGAHDAAPSQDLPQSAEVLVVNAAGLVLLPSLVDVHVHLREPGFEYKEDIASGLGAAAHGGFGRVLCMANTRPVNDHAAVTIQMLATAARTWPHGPFLHPIGALTKGLSGQELAPMAELAAAGCRAVSNDGLPVTDSERFRRAMEYAASAGLVVIDHCEDPFMAPGAGINEGIVSGALGLRGQPDAAEAIQVARDILLAEYLGLPVHLAHVSCARALELIRAAKARGVDVTAETCPHYLFLTDEACLGYNTLAKVSPPLRSAADVAAMRAAIADGTIDMLATDHAPHAMDEKDVEFELAPNGISGLDTALAWTWELVRQGVVCEQRFAELWHAAPSRRFGLPVNTFAPGDPADLVLFDPDAAWTVSAETLHSRGKNTPLQGQRLHGRAKLLVLGGQVIINDM